VDNVEKLVFQQIKKRKEKQLLNCSVLAIEGEKLLDNSVSATEKKR
jgi:hypothetical protein